MLLPELMAWRLQGDHFRCQIEKGDEMVDYEQVTQEVREGLARIVTNKGDKSVEIIMNEILGPVFS